LNEINKISKITLKCDDDLEIIVPEIDYEKDQKIELFFNKKIDAISLKPSHAYLLGGLLHGMYDRIFEKNVQTQITSDKMILDEKLKKLREFMQTEDFVELDKRNQSLLEKQEEIMSAYFAILGERINEK
jgi:hypothetical protein